MKETSVISFVLLIVLLNTSCSKHSIHSDYEPDAKFTYSPDSGNTTTVFSFSASETLYQGNEDNPVFIRWDWDGDGVWDQMFGTEASFSHRFLIKGQYQVIMEASTLFGKRDTKSVWINCVQGYSPPKPDFRIFPDSGNVLSLFRFDASSSRDDEDSLELLEFRWNFDHDESWDTDWSENPMAEMKFEKEGVYPIKLEVRDPQLMSTALMKPLVVTRLNYNIVAEFRFTCGYCTIEDEFVFDASGSYLTDSPNAKLKYSWDINNDNVWEEVNSDSPVFRYRIPIEGSSSVCLRVSDENDLYMTLVKVIEIFPRNEPPDAKLTLGNRFGNLTTVFYLHGFKSWDRTTSIMDLIFTWDTDDDGLIDDQYSNQREISINFDKPGKYPIKLFVTDPGGKTSFDIDTIVVINSRNPTMLIKKTSSEGFPDYYGAVKIGSRWWMQSNLRYIPPENYGGYRAIPYNDDSALLDSYGALYQYAALRDPKNPCPKDWRIPTVSDWRELMSELGSNATFKELLPGGQSEVHLFLSGQRDPNGSFRNINQLVNFWTIDDNRTGQTWVWYFDPGRSLIGSAVVARSYWFPIRCVKDD